jgi:hypothetical protein
MRSLLDFFFGRKPEPEQPAPPVLRNRAGGMAWVRGVNDHSVGASALNGRAVKTVRLRETGTWAIEPELAFIASQSFTWNGKEFPAGEAVWVGGIADECLEPWKDTGLTTEEVRDLYAPESGQHLPVYTYDDLPRQGQK